MVLETQERQLIRQRGGTNHWHKLFRRPPHQQQTLEEDPSRQTEREERETALPSPPKAKRAEDCTDEDIMQRRPSEAKVAKGPLVTKDMEVDDRETVVRHVTQKWRQAQRWWLK